MFRPRSTLFFSLMALSSLALTGCPGNSNTTTNGGNGTNGKTSTTLTGGNPNVIKIVSSFPRTGSAKQQTDTIVNGIKMAIDEAGGKVGEFTIEFTSLTIRRPAWSVFRRPFVILV